jgi:hypothetical protein
MHDDDIRRSLLPPSHEDEIMERSVLTQVLLLHPAQLSILELALRVETDLRSCEQDAVERAVRELSRDGLLSAIADASRRAGRLCALTSCLGVSPSGECVQRFLGGRGAGHREVAGLSTRMEGSAPCLGLRETAERSNLSQPANPGIRPAREISAQRQTRPHSPEQGVAAEPTCPLSSHHPPTARHTGNPPFRGGSSDAADWLFGQCCRDAIRAYPARSTDNRGNRPPGCRTARKTRPPKS